MLGTDQSGASGSTGRPRPAQPDGNGHVDNGFTTLADPQPTAEPTPQAGPDPVPTPALDRCIGISSTEFAQQYWSSTPLLTPATRGAGTFADLLSLDDVDELVSTRGLRTPFLRMAKNGSVLPTATFTRSGGVGAGITDQVADDKVLAQLSDGATLVLQALHRSWPPLVRFGSALAAELGHPVQINAYITPPQNQGFAAHYDTHDVFVLQVAGTKRWTIHRPVVDDPLPEQTWDKRKDQVSARASEKPLIDTLLAPGDALYLPRGYLHSAVAQGEVSVHLTVGVHPITGYDLASELLAVATDDRELRRSLPLGGHPDALAEQVRAAARRLAAVIDDAAVTNTTVAAVARRVDRRLSRDTRPAPISPLAQLTAIGNLQPGTALRVRSGLRPALRRTADRLSLDVIDRTVSWSLDVEQALRRSLSGDTFRPFELDNLDPDEQLVLARRLLREGIVVPADPGPPASD